MSALTFSLSHNESGQIVQMNVDIPTKDGILQVRLWSGSPSVLIYGGGQNTKWVLVPTQFAVEVSREKVPT